MKMINKPEINDASLSEKEPLPIEAKLYWRVFNCTYEVDCSHLQEKQFEQVSFPYNYPYELNNSRKAFKDYKEKTKQCLGSYAFWQSLRKCKYIYLCDKHFNQECFKRVCVELEKASKSLDFSGDFYIRIFTKELLSDIDKINQIADIRIIPYSEKMHIHDRIALLDSEIWHCGATIGGMHEELNAISGPWLDKDQNLKNFFTQLEKEFS